MEQNEPGAEAVHCYVSDQEAALYVRDEFKDAATINRISCKIFNRGTDIVLAMLYLDGSTVMYDEKDIGDVGSDTNPGWFQSRGGWF